MKTRAMYEGASRNLKGDLIISFALGDEEQLPLIEKMQDAELVLDVRKFRKSKSAAQNAYFWALCTEMAMKLGTSKEDIYKMQLKRVDGYFDTQVKLSEVPKIQDGFRVTEIMEDKIFFEGDDVLVTVRCYVGISSYNTEEMARLLDITIQDALEIGADVTTARLKALMEGAI